MSYDLAVIGAGPAGMSAASVAGALGLEVVVLDEQAREGGQIYRNVDVASEAVKALLGPDYAAGRGLVHRLRQTGVELRSGALVWDVATDRTVSLLSAGRSEQVRARHVLVATGAMERPSPVPGWTLPGVMNAGAAQIALKSGPSVPAGRVVLAGTGPLLLLVACQLLAAGTRVTALIETGPHDNLMLALRRLPGALRAPAPLWKGLRLLARLRASGVAWYRHASALAIEGDAGVRGVTFSHRGERHALPADMVLLHHGVVPNTQLTRLLRLEHTWSDAQLAWHPIRDGWGATSLDGIWIAGDGAGIDGARAAEASGALAALGVAGALGRIGADERDRLARRWQRQLERERAVRPFLDALYRPPRWIGSPPDAVLACRCEEVSAGRIREMARLGCVGPNQTKFFSRCGMGPCQGRLCGLTVTQILAEAHGTSPDGVGAYRVRAPIKPIPLHSLAGMDRESRKMSNHGEFSE
ncbi:FAD-dependent oxidoreductase [Burkholderia sp. 22PA0106]|uniref:FAD-dependent oxidoreductase n=1 Tax=Burkholderia sp. 22PA0106 TaxID=3237371 RepID=UPI0039C1EB45